MIGKRSKKNHPTIPLNILYTKKKKYFRKAKSFWRARKNNWRTRKKKQVEVLEVLRPDENKEDTKSIEGPFLKEMRKDQIENKIDEIKKRENGIKRKDLKLETNLSIYLSIYLSI